MSDQSEDTKIEEPELGSELSPRERALRDRFVIEYLTDYNSYEASIRIGYPSHIAKLYHTKFMSEPYVLQQIKNKETSVGGEEDKDSVKKRIMAGLLREANYRGPGCSQSARVAALSKLASMHGMDAPTRTQNEFFGPDGQPIGAGVFVIPGLMTPEQWEEKAAAQQQTLVAGTVEKSEPAVAANG